MQADTWYSPIVQSLETYLPTILGAVVVLLIGWIVALIASKVIRGVLGKLHANERLAGASGPEVSESGADYERAGGRIVFWIIFLMTLVAALSILNIEGFAGPLSGLVSTLVPAIILGVVAWLLATLVRFAVSKGLSATDFNRKLSKPDAKPLSKTLGDVGFWLVLLLFLPAIVGTLQIDALTAPLSNMIDDMLGMLPNLIAAAIIGGVGWLVATILREVVSNLLGATGIDSKLAEQPDAKGVQVSKLVGTVVFILVIIPTLIAALDALKIEAISAPLTAMLDKVLLAVPNILAAAVILTLAWFIGRFVANLVSSLLSSAGFDQMPERMGLGHAFAEQPATAPAAGSAPGAMPATGKSGQSLSGLVGKIVLFFIMLFATVEAAGILGFAGVSDLVEMLIAFAGNILLGMVILAVGFWLANLAGKAIERTSPDAGGMARIARFAILGLVLAMGLGAMGVADHIVNLAFGLILGAIAVAVALAFGLGGREAAGQVAQRWASQYLARKSPPGG